MSNDANFINLALAVFGTIITLLGIYANQKNDFPKAGIIIFIFLLSYPYKIGDNIYSVWGGRNDEGSVYSLSPLYADAKDDAVAFTGLGHLTGGRDAIQLLGIGGYIKGGHDAFQGFGIGYVNGGHDAAQVLGIGYQNGGRDAIQILGIGYQNGGRNAKQLMGMGVQIAKEGAAALGFGIPLYQKGATFTGVSWEKACP